MKLYMRITALCLCVLLLLPPAANAATGDDPETPDYDAITQTDEAEGETEVREAKLVLSDLPVSLSVGSKIKIKADPVDFETPPQSIKWTSDNTAAATVDNNGVVSCIGTGQATITASATDADTPVSASCVIKVVARHSFAHILLSLTYSYSAMGDYYYSDNDSAWQKPFGFMRLYDVASQLIGYQYDFKRIVFTYDNKDWLIEFWKGQYALFQYGGEIGVYTKPAVGFGDTPVSTYRTASRNDRLDMEMTLFQEQSDGAMKRVFTRDYDKYWWCDGYRIGRLRRSKPATELQMISRITLKDEKMAAEFEKGMKSSGFSESDDLDGLKNDCYYRDGCDVYFIWRNLTESQHFIPMFVDGDTLSVIFSFFNRLRLSH